jgi:hypothetical protein
MAAVVVAAAGPRLVAGGEGVELGGYVGHFAEVGEKACAASNWAPTRVWERSGGSARLVI